MPVTLTYDPSRTALYHPERRETLFERGRDGRLGKDGISSELASFRAMLGASTLGASTRIEAAELDDGSTDGGSLENMLRRTTRELVIAEPLFMPAKEVSGDGRKTSSRIASIR